MTMERHLALKQAIEDRIAREGPTMFESFMDMALYYPGLGYYASAETEIGRAGDFYTSPHLHRIFGAMLGVQAVEMWEIMGRPENFSVVEMGAGRGFMAQDMLDYLRSKGGELYDGLSYLIIERNPHMEKRQRELLAGHGYRVKWISSLGEAAPVRGLVLSNELVDSFPVHLIEMERGEIREIFVSVKDGKFVEILGEPGTGAIMDYMNEFVHELPEGARTEVNLRMKEWIKDIAKALEEGFLLTIDYGFPAEELHSEERTRGSLLCYRGHTTDELPLKDVGLKDITAHVNFTALRKWGEEAGMSPLGFAPQGTFLVSLGVDEVITEMLGGAPDYSREVSMIKGLLMPGTMGDTHKVMIHGKGVGVPALRGFSLRNRLNTL